MGLKVFTMRAIAYNVFEKDKELLVRANAKRHILTFISNVLNDENSNFAKGKDAIIIYDIESTNSKIIECLNANGVQKIIVHNSNATTIDFSNATLLGIKVFVVDNTLIPQERAWQIIDFLGKKT